MAAKRNRRIYWDSDVYIDRLQREASKIVVLEAITDAAEAGRITLLASTLVLAEVAKTDNVQGAHEEEKLQKLAAMWENEFFVVQSVDRQIALKAAEFVRQFGLKPPDAIHVATALALGAYELQTYDEQLLARDGLIGQPPLSIKKPTHPAPLPLFDGGDEEEDGEQDPEIELERVAELEASGNVVGTAEGELPPGAASAPAALPERTSTEPAPPEAEREAAPGGGVVGGDAAH